METMNSEQEAHYRKLKAVLAIYEAELVQLDNGLEEIILKRDKINENVIRARDTLQKIESKYETL